MVKVFYIEYRHYIKFMSAYNNNYIIVNKTQKNYDAILQLQNNKNIKLINIL